jgi:hypothetical protein
MKDRQGLRASGTQLIRELVNRATYYRLLTKAAATRERSIALELNYMRRHYPGFLNRENAAVL